MNQSISKNKFWSYYHEFCQELPKSNVSKEELLNILPRIKSSLANDMAAFEIHNAVRDFIKEHPSKGGELIDAIVKSQNGTLYEFLSDVIVSLSETNSIESTWLKLGPLFEHEGLAYYALSSVLRLEIDSLPKDKKVLILDELAEQLDRLKNSANTSIQGEVLRVLACLRNEIQWADREMLKLAEIDHIDIQSKIYWVLDQKIDKERSPDLYKTLFLRLSITDPQYMGLINLTGTMLRDLLVHDPQLLEDFLSSWVIAHSDNDEVSIKSFECFFLKAYKEQQNWFRVLLTKWLNHDETQFHRAFKGILSILFASKIYNVELDEEYIKSADFKGIRYLTSKILGYAFSHHHLKNLLFSILKSREDDNSFQIIASAFTEYVAINYHSTIEYLKERKPELSNKAKEVIDYIVDTSEAYFKALEELPKIGEVEGSEKRAMLYRKLETKQQQESLQSSQKGSFMKMAKQIDLKVGEYWFHRYTDGQYSEKQRLGKFEFSYEMPRAEFVNQYGMALARLHWTNEKRL
tara:strand:- start:3570 stop:5132 length:1563 start_codon:yes stop_codon:yes gene_type:complete